MTLTKNQAALLAAVKDGYACPFEATARAMSLGFRGNEADASRTAHELIEMGELRIGKHWELELA
jgi:hypothetical protein